MNRNTQTNPINIAVPFLGGHTEEKLLPALRLDTDFNLYTCSSRSPEKANRFKNKFGFVKTASTWQEAILDEKTEAVVICSSPQMHYKAAKLALENGKHVFIEKPPAMNLAQVKELAEIAESSRAGLRTFVGYNFTFATTLLQAKALLGPVKYFKARFVGARPRNINYHHKTVLEYGLYSILIHPLATLVNTLGPAIKHSFSFTNYNSKPFFEGGLGGCKFSIVNTLECKNGLGVIEWGNTSSRFECEFELIDENGASARISNLKRIEFTELNTTQQNKLAGLKGKEYTSFDPSPLTVGYSSSGYSNQFTNFKEAILTGTKTKAEISQSLEVFRILDEIERVAS